ncbi:hypothetical protein BH09BAC5_BH09BAC5_15930 [soil metagenome]
MRKLLTLGLFSLFTLGLNAQHAENALAMTSLNAVPRGTQVLLSWNPEQKDIITYHVERSKNGAEFTSFSEVEGTNETIEFLETDFTPLSGTSFYRLTATLESGVVLYSNVVPVKFSANGTSVSPVPQTTIGSTNLQKDKSVLMIVRSKDGGEYYSKVDVENAGDPVECSAPDPSLAIGTYTIVGCSEQDLYSKQLIVK